jgi:hypothetical protein
LRNPQERAHLDFAKTRGYRNGENPAACSGFR